VPDVDLLFTADFKRVGFDLILTSEDGRRIVLDESFFDPAHQRDPHA
jgi:hypothetical protein